MTDIRLRVNELFTQNGIEISFPQLDVHIRNSEGGAAAPAEAENIPVSDAALDAEKQRQKQS